MPSLSDCTVVNTSPVIYLSSIGRLALLQKLYHEIYIPEAVKREVLAGGKDNYGCKEIQQEKWIKTKKISNTLAKDYLLTDIDDGEAEVIVLAEELKASRIIMDDRLGRKIVLRRGFHLTGTLGLLVLAKKKGIVSEVKPLLKKIKGSGFWVSDDVFRAVLAHAGERP